ncbi:MAG: hypothetical protein ACQKBU_08490 [Verrucomicrobiales bacterium]
MPTVLVTGFDAWGDLDANPAWLAVESCTPSLPPDWHLNRQRIPVSWEQGFEQLLGEWNSDVAAVLSFGVAPIRGVALERIAINLSEGQDVDGKLPQEEPIIDGGPAAYWSTLPLLEIEQALHQANLTAKPSAHAGTYLCNHLFYRVMHHALWKKPEMPAGFIHLPNLRQPDSLTQDQLTEAVTISIETTVRSKLDGSPQASLLGR